MGEQWCFGKTKTVVIESKDLGQDLILDGYVEALPEWRRTPNASYFQDCSRLTAKITNKKKLSGLWLAF